MLPSQAIPGYKTTYKVITEGAGDKLVAKNSKVKVHATGTVIETDKKFWSTKDKGQAPFEYTAGVGGASTDLGHNPGTSPAPGPAPNSNLNPGSHPNQASSPVGTRAA